MASETGPRHSLALLALLTSAVVATTRGNDYFSLWDAMIGLIVVTVAAAYKHELGPDRTYRAAFSPMSAPGSCSSSGRSSSRPSIS